MPDFVGTDRLGHQVVLTDGTWYGHIVPVHPEMRALRAEVEAACLNADTVRQSCGDADCVVHFKQCMRRPGLLIKVVANVQDGFVRTAHLAKHESGGVQLWP
jgi:hypothetical protein